MPFLHANTYNVDEEKSPKTWAFIEGEELLENHPLFGRLGGDIYIRFREPLEKDGACVVDGKGNVYANVNCRLNKGEWAYALAHCLLHLAFGHFDKDKMPDNADTPFDKELWNKACDIYITRFLYDIHFPGAIVPDPADSYSVKMNDELKIYRHLIFEEGKCSDNPYGTNKGCKTDMIGLDHPNVYKKGDENTFALRFADSLRKLVRGAVSDAGSYNRNEKRVTQVTRAAEWFLTHYPLLGGIAASFKIIEDVEVCQRNEIYIAGVDASEGEIYVNPAAGLDTEEWKFVLAHEYLHAGLMHHKRSAGRDRFLWNVACDFVVNGWLKEMQIGTMPKIGILYDKELKDLSAEAIYDRILRELKRLNKKTKYVTLRGYGKGDIMSEPQPSFGGLDRETKNMSLDEFFKSALREGLDFHSSNGRGYLPAGLVDEIRALTSPPIPWDVELGKWFDSMFPPIEKHRSYARPSRRQGATPDIPRPRYIIQDQDVMDRTFGVVVDTS